MLSPEKKDLLIKTGILAGVFVVSLAILICMIFVSRNSWRNGLKAEVQKTLDVYSPETFTVKDYVNVDAVHSSEYAVYTLENRDDSDTLYFGIIIRIQTVAGPQPAVFVLTENGDGISFAGYAVDNGKAASVISAKLSTGNIQFWEDRILQIYSTLENFQ